MIRRQFTLRSLLVAMMAVGAACGWLASKRGAAQREREAAAEIVRRTGSVWYNEYPSEPSWIARLLGNDHPNGAVEVCFDAHCATDTDLAIVAMLQSVERLTIYCDPAQPITPSGLALLKTLRLRSLAIIGHPIGDQGLMELRDHVALERLELREEEISDVGIDCLGNLTNLRILYLGFFELPESVDGKLRAALPNCEIFAD
jgi:hypothetical protein